MTTAPPAAEKTHAAGLDRDRLISILGWLLAISLSFDYSIYVRVGHVYVHELATLGAALVGILIATRRRSVLPASKATAIPLAFLAFLALNSALLGAYEYRHVPAAMHTLFWLEHGDALRILAELAVWVWVVGLVEPSGSEIWGLIDPALWGGMVMVVLAGGYWVINQQAHEATTPYDLGEMIGLPLAAMYVIRQRRRRDVVRLAVFAGGSLLLYSRTAIVVLAVTTLVLLISTRSWRSVADVMKPVAVGWVVVIALTVLFGVLGARNVIPIGPPPGEEGASVNGSSIQLTLLRLLSLGDTQIAGYTLPSRTLIWKDALHIARRSPIVGVGYHDYFVYSTVSEIKTNAAPAPADLFSSLIKAAHNDYLSMLAETGVLGLLIYLAVGVLVIGAAARLWLDDEKDRPRHGLVLGFLVSMAGVSLFGEVLIPRTPQWLGPAFVWWIVIAALLLETDRRYGWFRWPRR